MTNDNTAERTIPIYTIYYNASDWPGEYVIKRWLVSNEEEVLSEQSYLHQDLSYLFNAATLEACREELAGKGLTSIGRKSIDDPVIVESWM